MACKAQAILIVEDDTDIREAYECILVDEGYTILLAANGLRGLEQARVRAPSLILLDLMMPVMNGWEFRELQKADPVLAGIPVIVISAAGMGILASLDVAASLPKPCEIDALVRLVGEHVAAMPVA